MWSSLSEADVAPFSMDNKLTVTRALIKLKTLNARINKNIPLINIVTISQNGKKMTNTSNNVLQQVQDLIEYRSKLKSALAISNATEKIIVAGDEYTVAAAIERKRTIETEKELLRHLESQYATCQSKLETLRNDAENRAERLIMTEAGKDSRSTDPNKVKELREAFLAGYKYELEDSFNMKDLLPAFRKRIEDFEGDIDAALSEKAGQTTLDIK
jgi:malonyl CoA-acyl carrier protein transacylase